MSENNFKKVKRKIKHNYYHSYCNMIQFLLIINFVDLISTNKIRNLYNYYSEIVLVVKGKEISNIIGRFIYQTSQILVNGENYDENCILNEDKNSIALKFDYQINSCESMFQSLYNIIEIDLSNFNSSKVTSMSYMFEGCSNLEKINFGKFKTYSVEDMEFMFYGCPKLSYLDLSNFDCSKVTSMSYMFKKCSNLEKIIFGNMNTFSLVNVDNLFDCCSKLISLDLSNFDFSKVTSMYSMFSECSKLEKINFGNINTSLVKNMEYLFDSCENLKYLDLSKFDTSKVTSIFSIFKNCNSLIYLNLYSFKFNNLNSKNAAFYGLTQSYIKYCILDEYTQNYLLSGKISNCSDICVQKNIKLDTIDHKCLYSCSESNYKYEYDNMCYKECPNGILANGYLCEDKSCDGINNNSIECLNKIRQGYYLDQKDGIYKQCFINCKFCFDQGTEKENNCIECLSNFTFLNDSIYANNCYEKCDYLYYFDESHEYHCDKTCPEQYGKLIKEKKKCINDCKNDDIYRYEYNNTCYKDCPNNTYKSENDEDYKCYNEISESSQLSTEVEKTKKCYDTCSKCDSEGNETNHNCIECKNNFTFYNDSFNISNCYEVCDYFYYFDESNKFHCAKTCPEQYNKLIFQKKKCIDDCKNDDIYKYEFNNTCLKEYQKRLILMKKICLNMIIKLKIPNF